MKIRIAYGTRGLDVEIPDRNLAGVLSMPHTPPLESPESIIRSMLERPIGCAPLREMAGGRGSACVVLCDVTRPVPNMLVLPPILEALAAAGIPEERTVLLIATGLHRPSTSQELEAMLGRELPRRYRIIDHRAREAAQQKSLGTTRRGTPVHIDRLYCEAELKISTGFIEPHLMAGFSGGRKLIAPGCAGEATIRALHSPAFLEDPNCREGTLEGNPLHEELLEIAAMAGHDFIVNVALDVEHSPIGIFAGHPLHAHAEGVRFVRRAVRAELPEPADIVLTTSAGHPLDLTYYQAVKGMTAALPIVKPGGLLILAAECGEGLGSPEFTRMATSFTSADAFMQTILSNPVVIDQWQLEECARATRHAEVILVSERIHREYGDRLFVGTAATVDDALGRGFRRLGSSARVAVIPKGPYTLVETAASDRLR